MTKVVTPSAREQGITDGQIHKAVSHYRDLLTKHRGEIGPSDEVQRVLGSRDYLNRLLAMLREKVEAVSNLVWRTVSGVDRVRAPQQMLEATGRTIYSDADVVEAMPRGSGEKKTILFINLGRYVSDKDLEPALGKALEALGFNPDEFKIADPYTLGKHNEADPAFADTHPNGTHWKDLEDKWCFAAFNRWRGGGRRVFVVRHGRAWDDGWWFPLVRR